jgi:phage repressor protein C with HTH and peptisase S24 domain
MIISRVKRDFGRMRKPRKIDERMQALGFEGLFQERLTALIEQLGGPMKVEATYGISREAQLKWRKGESRPPFLDLALLCSEAGRSIDWLAGITPEMSAPEDFELIPRLEVRASAGGGALIGFEEGPLRYSAEPGEFVAFRSDWLRGLGITAKNVRTMFAHGDSMEPTIRDGDLLLVDHSIDRIVDHGIYVVVYQGMVLVKRVQLRRDGTLVLNSDNERYESEVVTPADMPDIRVAGRVRWYGRTI